jgi:hypothetical protein
MVAVTRDFHVVASCVAASFSTEFFSVCYIAKAGYVCALFCLLSRHYTSILLSAPALSDRERTLDFLTWRRSRTSPSELGGIQSRRSVIGDHVISNTCM